MRPNCPVCGGKPIDTLPMDYAVPDGWPLAKLEGYEAIGE